MPVPRASSRKSRRSMYHIKKKMSVKPSFRQSYLGGGYVTTIPGASARKWAESFYTKQITGYEHLFSKRPSDDAILHYEYKANLYLSGTDLRPRGSYLMVRRESNENIPLVTLSTQLCELEVMAIAAVIEDINDMLGILERPDFGANQITKFLNYMTPEERFKGKPFTMPVIPDDNAGEDRQLRRQECNQLTTILYATLKELLLCGSYGVLQNACIIPNLIKKDEQMLCSDLKSNLNEIESMKIKLREATDVINQQRRSLFCTRSKIKDHITTQLSRFEKIEDSYSDKWNRSRMFQHSYNLDRQEKQIQKLISEKEEQIKNDVYLHANIRSFYRLQHRELKSQAVMYDNRHMMDIDSLDRELHVRKFEIADVTDVRLNLQDKSDHLATKMKFFRERRERLINDEREHRRREAAVRKIVRWWRHVYAMLKLKRKRKSKKGKKGKKGNKGKTGKKK